MVDYSTDTCATFIKASGSSIPAYIQFRIAVPFEESQEVSCFVTGTVEEVFSIRYTNQGRRISTFL